MDWKMLAPSLHISCMITIMSSSNPSPRCLLFQEKAHLRPADLGPIFCSLPYSSLEPLARTAEVKPGPFPWAAHQSSCFSQTTGRIQQVELGNGHQLQADQVSGSTWGIWNQYRKGVAFLWPSPSTKTASYTVTLSPSIVSSLYHHVFASFCHSVFGQCIYYQEVFRGSPLCFA